MRVHTNVILKISKICSESSVPQFIAVLLGVKSEDSYITECFKLHGDLNSLDSQICEFLELMRAVNPSIELVGLAYVGQGLDPAQLSPTPQSTQLNLRELLLIELSAHEPVVARAFTLTEQWHAASLKLISDQASRAAINDAFAMSGASDLTRAKIILRNKLQSLQHKLGETTDEEDISLIISKYSQLRKLPILNGAESTTKMSDTNPQNATYELIARVVAKSDERHRIHTAQESSHHPEWPR